MRYLEFTFKLTPQSSDFEDVFIDLLGEIGFDSFVKSTAPDEQMKGYIPVKDFRETDLKNCIADFPLPDVDISYTYQEAEDKDWNEVWEKNYFEPLVIGDQCVVAAPFHQNIPQAKFNITINPKMSFGTGHHETTSQMLKAILSLDLKGKKVLDMGCGTGLLAILAAMKGADNCMAIDIDEWCVNNAMENLALNHINNIEVLLGDATGLKDKGPFDVILANIHLNVILNDMPDYIERLNPSGYFLTSGFYLDDLPRIKEKAESLGLKLITATDERLWCCAVFQRIE